jgi:serine/threonine protein kinase
MHQPIGTSNGSPGEPYNAATHTIDINDRSKQLYPYPTRSFMCRSVSDMSSKPGKIRYMSPELLNNKPWDAFANDVFSCGVILYSLLTGRPPFQQATSSDLWFHVIYTGTWLTPQIRNQTSAQVFNHLSDDALDLINMMIKPQNQRPTCEQILQHRFMTKEDD